MNEKSVGILYALRQLYAADGTTLPRKAVAGLIDDVLTAEAGTARNTDLSAAASAKEEADVRPDMPAAQDWIEQIRAYGHKLIAGGAGMVQTVRILCDRTGLTKQDFADLTIGKMVEQFYGNSYASVVSRFVEEEKMDLDELKALIARIENHRK